MCTLLKPFSAKLYNIHKLAPFPLVTILYNKMIPLILSRSLISL